MQKGAIRAAALTTHSCTPAGGVAWPLPLEQKPKQSLLPQQCMRPVPFSIPQVWAAPAETACRHRERERVRERTSAKTTTTATAHVTHKQPAAQRIHETEYQDGAWQLAQG